MAAPKEILRLIERYEAQREAYESGAYKETQIRVEFIDPFFKALGWDVHNEQGFAEAYKDVIHEDALKIGGATEAPDSCFRIGGARKFFVECKKPSVNIKDAPHPAYQLRRYGWSAKLPVSILTDFEELAVYDCRIKPGKNDASAVGRVMYLTFKQYAERWDEIAAIFSRDAVLKGSFDKFAEGAKGKRGTASVDDAFLEEIERWRDLLARNIALRNPALSQRELNFAVQKTIDRIIFLRICEDRGIEPYGRLLALRNGEGVYPRLCELFQRADERYNSGLFHFRSEKDRESDVDELSLALAMDDKVLKDIFGNLYYPESPYEFSVLSADILGQVYERFLGKVIRLTAGHQAKVEEKPEVRKAGGVYYTPDFITKEIVRQTIGAQIEAKTPKQVAKLRFCDMACGSGSFLIAAFQFLIDWHRDYYVKDSPEKHSKILYRSGDDWRLATDEKKRILLNNIYGADIDSQAVEVTKLSLLLKVLEGESQESLTKQFELFHERALPDLGRNIQCGNSLIGAEAYQHKQLSLLPEEDRYRINLFDWAQAFPQVFGQGGFDAIIGNPPYIRIQTMKEWAPVEVELYKDLYRSAGAGNYDIYVVFVEKALGLLNKTGRLGFILPHKFFNAKYGEALRGLVAEGKHLAKVIHFGDQQVFAGATTYTCLMFLDKAGTDACRLTKVDDLDAWRIDGKGTQGDIPADKITASEWNFVVGEGASLFERLSKMPVKLGDIAEQIFVGLQTSADTVFLFKEFKQDKSGNTEVMSAELGQSVLLESAVLKRVIRSGSIGRYCATPTALILFPYEVRDSKARLYTQQEMLKRFPLAWDYLVRNRELLAGREHGKFKSDWHQLYPKNLAVWEQPKLMIPYMIQDLAAYLDREDDFYFVNVTTGGFGVTINEATGSLEYVCALLNSKLLDFYLKQVASTFHGGYFAANKQYIEQLPIRPIDFGNPEDKARHDEIVRLVQDAHVLHRRLALVKSPPDKESLERQSRAIESQINGIVCGLYGVEKHMVK